MNSLQTVSLEKDLSEDFSITLKDGKQPIENLIINRLIYNQMVFVQKGSGQLRIDDENYGLGIDQLFLFSKGQILSIDPKTVFEGFVVIFRENFWQETPSSESECRPLIFSSLSDNNMLTLPEITSSELSFLFKCLWQEYRKPGYTNKSDVLAAFLKIIMIKIVNMNTVPQKAFDSYDRKLYHKFMDLLNVDSIQSHEVSSYARQMGISMRKLAELSKKYSGKATKDLISSHLTMEAKRLLQFSSMPIKEIAYELNFSTPDQFSHFFKKNTLLSPQNFRTKSILNLS